MPAASPNCADAGALLTAEEVHQRNREGLIGELQLGQKLAFASQTQNQRAELQGSCVDNLRREVGICRAGLNLFCHAANNPVFNNQIVLGAGFTVRTGRI